MRGVSPFDSSGHKLTACLFEVLSSSATLYKYNNNNNYNYNNYKYNNNNNNNNNNINKAVHADTPV